MVHGGDWGGLEGWAHWVGEIKKTEGWMKKRGPGRNSI